MLKVDKELLKKLPKYAQGWDWVQLQQNGRSIDAMHKPLDDDPRKNEDEIVEYTCYCFSEFIWYIKAYNKNFKRMY